MTNLTVVPDEAGKRLAIVALGPSSLEYIVAAESRGAKEELFDEVWSVNTYASVIKCDLLWHMDDIRVQMARAKENEKIAALVEHLRHYQGRVITSRTHPDFPCLEAFPLEQIVQEFKCFYFNNTVAYAMAYAIWKGYKEITLYGCDYNYQMSQKVEPGRACLEFWLGRAWERGVLLKMGQTTSLMDTNDPILYGYDTMDVQHRIDEAGQIRVRMTPKDLEINAAEIEKRYSHDPKEVA